MRDKKVCVWDLEGPISTLDFAAELGRLLKNKPKLGLESYNMGEFFTMISNYDDYLIDIPGVKEKLGIPEYQPGDTLRLMAPLYIFSFNNSDLISIAKSNLGLLPGCQEFMEELHNNWEIFVVSTSYTQFAHSVTKAIKIPQNRVYCTNLNIENLKIDYFKIKQAIDILIFSIFENYLNNGKNLNSVIDDLNNFFWLGETTEYHRIMNQIEVRGGKRKELSVIDISKRTSVPISNMIAIGDSITDINMLERVNREGGFAVSFNGNRFSMKYANISVATKNLMGALPIFDFYPKILPFIERWENSYINFKNRPQKIPNSLISDKLREYFINEDFIPEFHNLLNKNTQQVEEIIINHVKMRKLVRGWAGNLS